MTRTLDRIVVRADLGELEPLFAFLSDFCARNHLPAGTRHDLSLVVEELVVNVIEHGYAGRGDGLIDVTLKPKAGAVEVWVVDDAPPFDPLTAAGPPDTLSAIDERAVGGLGIHLVKTLTLDRAYRHEGGRNVVWAVLAAPGAPP